MIAYLLSVYRVRIVENPWAAQTRPHFVSVTSDTTAHTQMQDHASSLLDPSRKHQLEHRCFSAVVVTVTVSTGTGPGGLELACHDLGLALPFGAASEVHHLELACHDRCLALPGGAASGYHLRGHLVTPETGTPPGELDALRPRRIPDALRPPADPWAACSSPRRPATALPLMRTSPESCCQRVRLPCRRR